MTRKEINLIAEALRRARGTGYIYPEEKNMWEMCVGGIAEQLECLPNFDRAKFWIACGGTPTFRVSP